MRKSFGIMFSIVLICMNQNSFAWFEGYKSKLGVLAGFVSLSVLVTGSSQIINNKILRTGTDLDKGWQRAVCTGVTCGVTGTLFFYYLQKSDEKIVIDYITKHGGLAVTKLLQSAK